MRELSLNILDICKNGTKALASRVEINLSANFAQDCFEIEIIDNGSGMDGEFLKNIEDPFTTTRKTRKVGMGIPLFKMSALQAEGDFEITSKLGVGTRVKASYKISSVDRMPLGDIASTMQILIAGDPKIDFVLRITSGKERWDFSSKEVCEIVGEENMCEIEVLDYIYNMIKENSFEILGGKL